MSISFESITFPSSPTPGTDRKPSSAREELRRQLQNHRPLPPTSQLFFLTEYSRLDGMWRLTNAPRADSADVPSIGEALALGSASRTHARKIFVKLDDCPILHSKAREALEAREACAKTGCASTAVPFPVKASNWRHPSPEPSLAWHCRRGGENAEKEAREGEKILTNGQLAEVERDREGREERVGHAESQDQVAPESERAERARISKLLWRTEASASCGSVLPTDLHFPARYYPTRREFSESFPLQRGRHSGLCTSIKHSRLPRELEPLGGV